MTQTHKLILFTALATGCSFIGSPLALLCALPMAWDLTQTLIAEKKADELKNLSEKVSDLEKRLNNAVSNMTQINRGF